MNSKQPKLPKSFPAKGWRRVKLNQTILKGDVWFFGKTSFQPSRFAATEKEGGEEEIGYPYRGYVPLYRKIKSKKGRRK